MNLQTANQGTATAAAFSAGIDPALPTEPNPSSETESAKESGSSRKGGKPGSRSTSANRNLAGNEKKLNPKRGSRMKSAPAVPLTFPKKKTRVRRDNVFEQTAVPVRTPSAADAPLEEKLREICAVLREKAPSGTEGVVDELRLPEREIRAESQPAQDFSSVSDLKEPDWLAADITLAAPDTVRLNGGVPPIKKRGLLTVTLRVRHSPMAVVLKSLDSLLTQGWSWMQQKLKSPRGKKRLRVCESVSLGEKRFVAVIQVDGEQFLVGGSASSVSTLAHLERSREFSDVFERHCKQDLSPA
jgi:Flagellar biosynthesis protein, FliO